MGFVTEFAADASSPLAAPVAESQRVLALDAVRGLAVLGILVMNVVEFSWPFEAYENPGYAGGSTGVDLVAWYVQIALFDGRMRALFSMLFGAGLVLLAERMERSGRAASAADLLLRRCLWLVPFGIVHRFGLQWSGDILYQYGLLGLVAIPFRRLSARALLVLGCVVLALGLCRDVRNHVQLSGLRESSVRVEAAEKEGAAVTAEDQAAQKRWRAMVDGFPPKPEDVQKQLEPMRGDYLTVFAHRWNYHHTFQSAYLYYVFVFDVLGMMFLGMGLMRAGFFRGDCGTRTYAAAIALGLASAGASLWLGLRWDAVGFAPTALEERLWAHLSYPWTRALTGLGWAAVVILCVRAARAQVLTRTLATVGRMAFTNYVLQTLCCTMWFYGYGMARYGTTSRAELGLVVLVVTAVQIAFSFAWLRWFRFGPLEWAWRSLTYWRRQPMLR